MDLPTLRQLEYALALGETLSFREAARECHVTQPSLSAQVQLLEDLLGVVLFERDRRRVILTEDGVRLLEHARRVVAEARAMVEVSREIRAPLSGSLCLGAISTVAPYVLPPVFRRVSEAYSEAELHLCEESSVKIQHKLASGDLDLILIALESLAPERFATLPLFEDELCVALPVEHPLAEHERLHESDLIDESILLLSEGHGLRDQTIALCQRVGVRSFDTHRAGSLTTLVQMVASGLGVTLLPKLAVGLEVDRVRPGEVVTRPFADPAPSRTVALAWRHSCPRERDFLLFGEEVRRAREESLEGAGAATARSAP